MRARIIAAATLALLPSVASAGEIITYSYDAKGRLTKVVHADSPGDGASTAYQFDAADNRTGVTVSAARSSIVVVPLNRMTVIPIG